MCVDFKIHLFGSASETAEVVRWGSWWGWSPGWGYLWRDDKHGNTPARHCLWPLPRRDEQSINKRSGRPGTNPSKQQNKCQFTGNGFPSTASVFIKIVSRRFAVTGSLILQENNSLSHHEKKLYEHICHVCQPHIQYVAYIWLICGISAIVTVIYVAYIVCSKYVAYIPLSGSYMWLYRTYMCPISPHMAQIHISAYMSYIMPHMSHFLNICQRAEFSLIFQFNVCIHSNNMLIEDCRRKVNTDNIVWVSFINKTHQKCCLWEYPYFTFFNPYCSNNVQLGMKWNILVHEIIDNASSLVSGWI